MIRPSRGKVFQTKGAAGAKILRQGDLFSQPCSSYLDTL